MNQLRVGISIALERDTSIWNSGINQNIAFLVLLLRASGLVGKVYLLNGGTVDELPGGSGLAELDVPFVKPQDVTHDLDLVIECGVTLPVDWLKHVRALGARVVTFFVGHVYASQAEGPIFGRHTGTTFVGTPWHEVWTLPHHMKTSGPLLRTVARVPVLPMPHIWAPTFLDRQVREMGAAGERFGFRPERAGKAWRAAIFEPNISVVKSCFIPMLACESAYRTRPEAVAGMMVLNTFHMKEHPTFNAFAAHLDLTRDHKATYEPRLAFPLCMAEHGIDAVVTHHWECGLNYIYYDALYGGYPLVHNSEFLQADGMGFYYPGFAATEGGQALLDAWSREPGFWAGYKARAADYLRGLVPEHPRNVAPFAQRIRALMEIGE